MAVDRSLNMVVILGTVGKDPDIRTTQGGQEVGNISLATDEGYFDKNQQWVDATEWHRITVWGRAVGKLKKMRKGDNVMVEGSLKTDSWDDPQSGQKRYSTSIVARRVKLVNDNGRAKAARDSGGDYQNPNPTNQPSAAPPHPQANGGMPPAPEDDLPF